MIMTIVTVLGLIIAAGLLTGIVERHLSDDLHEFCEIECKKNNIIYK